MRQLIGCEVTLEVECGDECREIKGIICNVGRDFVEIEKLDVKKQHQRKVRRCTSCRKHDCDCKHHRDDFVIIPLNEIKLVKLEDDKKDCC